MSVSKSNSSSESNSFEVNLGEDDDDAEEEDEEDATASEDVEMLRGVFDDGVSTSFEVVSCFGRTINFTVVIG